MSILQYTQDYDEKYPIVCSQYLASQKGVTPVVQTAGLFHDNTQIGHFGWIEVIQPYTKSVQIFYCPSDHYKDAYNDLTPAQGYASYGMNSLLGWSLDGTNYNPGDQEGSGKACDTDAVAGEPNHHDVCWDRPFGLAAVERSVDKILVTELGIIHEPNGSLRGGAKALDYYKVMSRGGNSGCPNQQCIALDNNPSPGVQRSVEGMHFGGANVLFCDGHVKFVNSGRTAEYDGQSSSSQDLHWKPLSP